MGAWRSSIIAETEWSNVIFSDGSSIAIDFSDEWANIWRCSGEGYNQNYIIVHNPHYIIVVDRVWFVWRLQLYPKEASSIMILRRQGRARHPPGP